VQARRRRLDRGDGRRRALATPRSGWPARAIGGTDLDTPTGCVSRTNGDCDEVRRAGGTSTREPYAVEVFGKRDARSQRASPEARRLVRFRRLIGLRLDEAQALAEERGVILRDFPEDHEGNVRVGLTADFRPNRITVGTKRGVVRRIIGVG
jgi:hypothetical protein